MITTATEIKHIENILKGLKEFEINVDLDHILFEELNQELPSDINCCW